MGVNLCILLEWAWEDELLEMGPPVGVFLVQLEGLGEVGLLRHAAARACE